MEEVRPWLSPLSSNNRQLQSLSAKLSYACYSLCSTRENFRKCFEVLYVTQATIASHQEDETGYSPRVVKLFRFLLWSFRYTRIVLDRGHATFFQKKADACLTVSMPNSLTSSVSRSTNSSTQIISNYSGN